MADLDDFFAKKDRKKSKSTKKFSTTEEVAKKLEDSAKKTEKVKKERIPEGEDNSTPVHEQDEWKDFEEEKKDYSGLKIGNLTIQSPPEGTTPKETIDEQQQEIEPGQETEKKVGPWKRIEPNEIVPEEPPQQQLQQQQQQQQQQQTNTTYIPPNKRISGQPQIQPSRLKSKAAPDIHNEEFFPTLSKTSDFKKNRSEGTFEVVQHNRSLSHKQAEQSKISSTQGPKLTLGNRYNTLSNDS